MNFCKKCNNLLSIKIIDNKVMNVCNLDGSTYEITNNIIERRKFTSTEELNYDLLFDDSIMTVRKKCPNNNCNNEQIFYIINKNMKNIYLCRQCFNTWS